MNILATLPTEITTLVTDASGLVSDVIDVKVIVLGAVLGFAFVGWLTSRKR